MFLIQTVVFTWANTKVSWQSRNKPRKRVDSYKHTQSWLLSSRIVSTAIYRLWRYNFFPLLWLQIVCLNFFSLLVLINKTMSCKSDIMLVDTKCSPCDETKTNATPTKYEEKLKSQYCLRYFLMLVSFSEN